jgi:hypothetical protein
MTLATTPASNLVAIGLVGKVPESDILGKKIEKQ